MPRPRVNRADEWQRREFSFFFFFFFHLEGEQTLIAPREIKALLRGPSPIEGGAVLRGTCRVNRLSTFLIFIKLDIKIEGIVIIVFLEVF